MTNLIEMRRIWRHLRHLGLTISVHPFFWTWDCSWQSGWGAVSLEIGPLAFRLFLAEPVVHAQREEKEAA